MKGPLEMLETEVKRGVHLSAVPPDAAKQIQIQVGAQKKETQGFTKIYS